MQIPTPTDRELRAWDRQLVHHREPVLPPPAATAAAAAGTATASAADAEVVRLDPKTAPDDHQLPTNDEERGRTAETRTGEDVDQRALDGSAAAVAVAVAGGGAGTDDEHGVVYALGAGGFYTLTTTTTTTTTTTSGAANAALTAKYSDGQTLETAGVEGEA